MARYVNIQPGDPAPWFHQRSPSTPRFAFDTVGGRYIVLCFFGSGADPAAQRAIAAVAAKPTFFDDITGAFFGVSFDAGDEQQRRLTERYPGLRYFYDFDGQIGRLFGAIPTDATGGRVEARRLWIVLDPMMRVIRVVPFQADGSEIAGLFAYLDGLPPVGRTAGFEVQAPVLVLPNVFEPELCQKLISLYEAHGGEESGFMREVGGKTVAVTDHAHKRRRDFTIEDPELVRVVQGRFNRRVVPEMKKAYFFNATRMERYIVGCYTSEDGGHFRAHRDNTTKGTAHRRFACSINLNDAFEGGEVSFPEYGPRSFKPPPGGAVVFSCSLLHAVSKVTSGRRYAFLPFLYDEEGAKVREANNAFLGEGVGSYKVSA